MRSEHVRLGLIALLACTLLACNDKQSRKDLPDWSKSYEMGASDGGVADDARVVPIPAGGFGIVVPDDVEYPHRLFEEGRPDSPCAIDLGDESHKDIRCIYDTDELDLFVLGFKIDVITPKGGCDFVLYDPYLYESWEIGEGPTEVSYTVNEDGTFVDGKNSENGDPVCKFDHSRKEGGPNCCFGTYTLTITSAMTGDSTVSFHDWGGGSISKCFDGGGFLLEGAEFTPDGFPADPIYYVDREHQVIHIEEHGFSAKYGYANPEIVPTNVQLANFFDSSKGTAPRGLRGGRVHPDYTLVCLDDAEEVLGRIRFQVREWNEELQFDMNGDPDSAGVERDFDSPVNDILDWKDIGDLGFDFNNVVRASSE